MKKSTFYCIMLCFSGVLQAQHDSFPAILRVFPEKGGAYAPVFSTFCSDRCWLSEREFDLTSMRFVPRDSTSCVPIFTKRIWHGSDPADLDPTTLQWQADEYDFNYLWTYEYRSDQLAPGGGKDTLILWRYDRQKARQDSFASLLQGEITIGKPGIWVTDHKEMVLLDRRSGQVLSRAENPDGLGVMMRLQAWGDDVIVNDRWLYQRIHARYVPFFPLPADMEGCNSPQKLEFQGELCLSSIREEGNLYAYYLVAPGHPPIKMPFEPNNFSYQGYLLAANPPLAWLCEKDTLRSFDFTMGGTSAYPGSTIEPLHGNHDGRFLGFYSELGLSFFDKYNCQFRVLQLPYGHKMPRNFTANHRYIFLTYENHWDIVNFSKLETAFRRSTILDEYAIFEQAWRSIQNDPHEEFYSKYEAYFKLYNRYKGNKNPKIESAWEQVRKSVSYPLYAAPDSILERVAIDFEAGRFDPSVSCEIAQGLFRFWGSKGELLKSLRLLSASNYENCIVQEMESGEYIQQMLQNTQHSLDSISRLKTSPDEKLYATGKVWLNYCLYKRWFRYVQDPREGLEQAFDYYRTLLQKYPKSPWADNAAYDTLYYIDYHATTTDDETPDGNDKDAYRAFDQFLKDYPSSDCRADVLLRMAKVIIRGAGGRIYERVSIEQAEECLQTIAKEYPDFAKNSADYQKSLGSLNARLWSARWVLGITLDQTTFRLEDTIRVTVKISNTSRNSQTLDTIFLRRWHERLSLTLHPIRDKSCEDIWGEFPLIREKTPVEVQAVTLLPGSSYIETFVLGHSTMKKNYDASKFNLAIDTIYSYHMEYHHPTLQWLWMSAPGGRFSVE